MNKNNPIGIFDSGIGGLTVAKAILSVLPKENLIYFGDTKHLPYGEKSARSIECFSTKIAFFLKEKKCKMIVIACNTASSLAYESIKKIFPTIEIINVIDPVVNLIYKNKPSCIGIIGTKGTINSKIYPKKIHEIAPKIKVKSLATPLLASIIEEGFFNDKISRVVLNKYLNKSELKNIDQLILACTHYPLIQKLIGEFYNNKIDIIDSASQVASHIKNVLEKKDLLSNKITGHRFFVSDYTKSFEESAKFFFGEDIYLEEVSSIH